MLLFAAFVWLAIPQHSPIVFGDDPFADFDVYAEAALRDWNTPALAVSVVKEGRVVCARGYGVRSRDGNDPVDTGTVMPIASITKSINATALAILVDDGKQN
jgi:CubicO group peptidase (beta-lactamase class C family)